MSDGCTVNVRFHPPPATLARYFTSFYETEVIVEDGGRVTDWLHPEWAGLRFIAGDIPDAELPGKPPVSHASFIAHGPTSTCIRFTAGSVRMWGVGLLPLGWAKFVGAPAAGLADVLIDGHDHPAFADFVGLADGLFGGRRDSAAELARIEAHFLARKHRKLTDEDRIVACHAALVDADVANVAEMAEHAGIAPYTLERVCRRHFGFPPQLLLRRQRFMRSLAQFMLDPSLKWIGALDSHYHDQAQFVRDFHRFMGMNPRDYAAKPHPILGAVMRARHEAAGAAVQALHLPTPRPTLHSST
ncbi:MAG TPA: helix-turn-helix domain-containing protein [Novosphingobium sp.]|nr:helix-turn-helix domain-containing protein [Novosphingobium sp.]